MRLKINKKNYLVVGLKVAYLVVFSATLYLVEKYLVVP